MVEVRKKLGVKYLYKLTVYGSWWNRRGNRVGRNYRVKVEATTFNEACLAAARQVADKYNCSCEVIGSW
jgi:hypothetical protein